jgi:two-component system, LytTR family, sensor kinase
MWKPNAKISFDDRLITALFIPLTALVIPVVFFGLRFSHEPLFTWNIYGTTLLITTTIWLGNRYILIWARNRYPNFKDVSKRLRVQSLAMLGYTVICNNLLGFFLKGSCDLGKIYGYADMTISSNAAALFCTFTVIAVYESIYFKNELKKSVEEKELLKRESLNAQLDALRTQVNPHFLFNNLNTLSSVIPEDPHLAVEFVQQLSKVYRHILEIKDEQSILLQEELEVLRAYAFLLKTRFGSNLDIVIDVPEEKLKNKIVPLSLQILMENAIKHNIVSSDKPLKIDVFAYNGNLVVSNKLQKKNQIYESTGIGLNNIRNRYKLISTRKVEVVEDTSQFTVSIPLIEK